MAEKVAHVMQLCARLEQAAGELSPEVVESKTDDAGLTACGAPRGLDGGNSATNFVTEDECVRRKRLAVRICPQHLQNGS